jgi:heptosyltransferase I
MRLTLQAPEHTLNLNGKTSLKQLAALLSQADVLLAPDTGAVHIATALGTPVIGLYAVATPGLTGPYQHQQYCVDRYPDALSRFLGAGQHAWNTRVHHPDAMSLITVDEVMQQFKRVLEIKK